MKIKNKRDVFVWSLFDFANSTYATIIVAFVFAVFFKNVISEEKPIGDFYWSLGINISMIISAVLNPVCGAIADLTSNKKKFLIFFTILCAVPTSLMFFTGTGTVVFALILFIFSNIGFQTGMTFYDAFIPEIGSPEEYNKISGIGYAVGYVGSLISVFLVFPLKDNPNLLFLITGFLVILFSLPLFLGLKEKKTRIIDEKINYIKYGFTKVKNSLKNIGKTPDLKNFLISFFFYIDSINTIIFFSGIFASTTLGFSITQLAIFFILVQITALFGSLLFSKLGDKLGLLKSLNINLFFWVLIILSIFFFVDKNSYISIAGTEIHLFYIVGSFAGFFLGSTQSLSRALMSKLLPLENKAEFFGFYALMDKTSTLLGPILFGTVSYFSGGNQKLAVLTVGMLFILGFIFLNKVKGVR
ncbi:MAG TPA: MFS transporter [Ignavibacteria bacterium]|nr:MFS transporter [Ignavibacteria bacterium]